MIGVNMKHKIDKVTKKVSQTISSYDINLELKKYLDGLDLQIIPFDELAVAEAIKKILTADKEIITNKFDLAEYMTFYFWANDSEEAEKQKKYYYPLMSGTTNEGLTVEFPDSRNVDQEVLEYWKTRVKESNHPLIICRYADLVVDFNQRINNGSISYLDARKVIDSTVQICNNSLDDGLGCKQKLKRALYLAKLINDTARQKVIAQTIVDTELKFAEDDKPGLWGYGFEWLLLDYSKEGFLTDSQRALLLSSLEQRLDRLTSAENPSSWNVECAVLLLAKYYSKKKDEVKLESALQQLESSYRRNIYANSDGLLVVNYLEKLSEIYLNYGKYSFAKDSIQRLKIEMSNLAKHTKFDLHKISIDMDIKREDIDAVLDSLFGRKREVQLDQAMRHIAINFIPRKNKIEKELRDLSGKYVYLSLGNNSIMSSDGFSLAKYGSVQEDFDRHLLNHFSQNLQFQMVFLHLVFNELVKTQTPDDIYKVLSTSPVFRDEDKTYLIRVLKDYWEGDYLSSSCLMIPLIEDSIRNIYRLNNLSFIKTNNDGGYDVESLNTLLERGVIKTTFRELGEHVEFYFRVLLTERIGWNLRNNFAHGINKNSFIAAEVADRLLHVLFCLSLVKSRSSEAKS